MKCNVIKCSVVKTLCNVIKSNLINEQLNINILNGSETK